MGAELSMQVAEQVILACQRVDCEGRIDKILLDDETFQEKLSSLSLQIPTSLHRLIIRKTRRERKSYGGANITEHRGFRRLWAASESRLTPVVRRSLYSWYQEPPRFLQANSDNRLHVASVNHYLEHLYHLGENRQIDTVRWRLSLIPLSDLFERFNRAYANAETHSDLVTIISESGLDLPHGDEIRESLPSWLQKSKRYKTLSTEVGYGGICSLPEGQGDSLWEKDLPQKGPVHDACVRLLRDNGIEEAASENVTGDDTNIVIANTAAEKIVRYLGNFVDGFQFLRVGPQGPLYVLATAAAEANEPPQPTKDNSSTRRDQNPIESQRRDTLRAENCGTRNRRSIRDIRGKHVPQKRLCEFASTASKHPRILSHDTGDGHNLALIPISDGCTSTDDNRSEQSFEECRRSPSSATDPIQEVNSNCPARSYFSSEQMASSPEPGIEQPRTSPLNFQLFGPEYSHTGNNAVNQPSIMRTPPGDNSEFDFEDLPNPLITVPSNGSESDWRHFSTRLEDNNVAENQTWANMNDSGGPAFNWQDLPNPLSNDDWNDLSNMFTVT